MELQGETEIRAPREKVWAALNDPAVLARAIDGVERLEAASPTRFEGVLNAKVGPVKAKFSGAVELTEIDAPNRYVLVGEGKGGVAGFAKGSADVTLTDLPDGGTRLAYVARSQVGGKLAQLGTRLIEGTARGYAEGFFAALKAELEGPAPAAGEETAAATAVAPPPAEAMPAEARAVPGWIWIAALSLLVLILLYWLA